MHKQRRRCRIAALWQGGVPCGGALFLNFHTVNGRAHKAEPHELMEPSVNDWFKNYLYPNWRSPSLSNLLFTPHSPILHQNRRHCHRDSRHFALWPHHCCIPRAFDRSPAYWRSPGWARHTGDYAGSQHYQAAEHQCVYPAAEGRD